MQRGRGVYEKFLYIPLYFALNIKLSLKKKKVRSHKTEKQNTKPSLLPSFMFSLVMSHRALRRPLHAGSPVSCFFLVCKVASVVSDSLQPYGLQPAKLLCPWDSSEKNTGVGCHALLQGVFPTQESNPSLLHLLMGSLPPAPSGKPLSTICYARQFTDILIRFP